MKFLLLTITLSMTYAMETTISGGAQEEEAPVMVPKAEWARDAHDTPGTLVDGRIKVNDPQSDEATGTTGGATGGTTGGATGGMTGGATGGMARGMTGGEDSATGESGLVNNPKEPQAVSDEPCADCGTAQDKVEDDGSNKRPIIAEAHQVMHTTYNETGDYEGKGTPIEGTTHTSDEKCCRVCPPADECENKDECFHKCKRVCGPTCEIDAPPALCDKSKEDCDGKSAGTPAPITPEMVQILADTPVEQKVAKIKALLRGVKSAAPKKVSAPDTGAVVVDDAVGAAL